MLLGGPSAGCSREVASRGGVDGGDAGVQLPRWECPADWVPAVSGGCGPAVLLCAPDGGAAPGACEGHDPARSRPVDDDAGATFRLLPDGAIGGAWPEPGDPDGPPAANWRPDAGIDQCPEGWSRRDDGACDPRVPVRCPEGSDPLPGGRCTDTAQCPKGSFPEPAAEETGRRAYVLAGSDDRGATGTTDRPFGTVAAAVAAAGPGGVVLLGPGVYREHLELSAPVTLRGLCPSRVTVEGPSSDALAVITVLGPESGPVPMAWMVRLRGMTLRGAARGVRADRRARVDVERLRVDGASLLGVQSRGGAAVFVRNTAIVHTRSEAGATFGTGVVAVDDSSAELDRVSIGDQRGPAVMALGRGGRVTARDTLLRGFVGRWACGDLAAGAYATEEGVLDLDRVVIEDVQRLGITVNTVGSQAILRDVVVRGVRQERAVTCNGAARADRSGLASVALAASRGGSVIGQRVLVEDMVAYPTAVNVRDEGSRVHLARSVVRGLRPDEQYPAGTGGAVYVDHGASFSADGVHIEAPFAGLVARDDGRLDVRSSVIEPALPSGAPHFVGVEVGPDATMSLSDIRIAVPTGGFGVHCGGTLKDVGARLAALNTGDAGVAPDDGDAPDAATPAVDGGEEVGERRIRLSHSLLSPHPFVVGAGQPSPTVGVSSGHGCQLEMTRTRLDGIGGPGLTAGVYVSGEGSTLVVVDSVVGPIGRAEGGAAQGVSAFYGGHAELRRSVVSNAGVHLSATTGGSLDLRDLLSVHAPDGLHPGGPDLVVLQAGRAAVRRLVAEGAGVLAVQAAQPGSRLDAEDLLVRRVRGLEDGSRDGFGVTVLDGADARVTRTAVDGAGVMAFAALDTTLPGQSPVASNLLVEDVYVRDTVVRRYDTGAGTFGPALATGLYAGVSCGVDVHRGTLLGGSHGAVIFGSLTAVGLLVADSARCAISWTPTGGAPPPALRDHAFLDVPRELCPGELIPSVRVPVVTVTSLRPPGAAEP